MINQLSDHHAAAALRWFHSMRNSSAWGLRFHEQLILLGGIKRHTYQKWQRHASCNDPINVPPETLERLSVLLGIYRGLKMIAPNERPDLAYRWFNTPNKGEPFCGMSPKAYAIREGSLDALYSIRRYLESTSA